MSARQSALAWAALGAVYAVSLWYAWSLAGAFTLLAAIGVTFLLPRRVDVAQGWAALLVCGVLMSGALLWATATEARCPAPGQTVPVKKNKPEVTCGELQASYLAMASFFIVLAAAGGAWQRRLASGEPGGAPLPG